MTNHPSIGNGTLNGSGGRIRPSDALQYWLVVDRYVLARSQQNAMDEYVRGRGTAAKPATADVPPARCIRTRPKQPAPEQGKATARPFATVVECAPNTVTVADGLCHYIEPDGHTPGLARVKGVLIIQPVPAKAVNSHDRLVEACNEFMRWADDASDEPQDSTWMAVIVKRMRAALDAAK